MRVLVALLLVAMAGVALWLLAPTPLEEPVNAPPEDPAVMKPAGQEPVSSTVKLRVQAVTTAGAPAQGHVAFTTGPDFRSVYAELELTPAGRTGEPFRGAKEFSLSPGSEAWFRLQGDDGSMALLRMPKSSADAKVLLGAAPSTIYAIVFGPDWRTPQGSAKVQATLTPDAGGAQRDLGTFTAGADGVLVIEGLEAGNVVLRPHGFRPGDGPPFVASVTVGNKDRRHDAVATLVLSAERRQVKIDALVQQQPASSAWLVVKRVDRPDGVLLWSPEALHEGAQPIALALAEGEWQPAIVPVGELTIAGGDGLLSVRGPGPHTFSMHFAPAAARAELTMTGIDARHLPLRVMALPADGLREDDPERYLGSPQWPALRASVPALPGPVLVVAQGRGANFVAAGSCRLQSNVTVAMQPACWLTVERVDWDPAAKPEVLAVDCGGTGWAAPMRPRLVPAPAGNRIVLAADLALPLGKAMVQGQEVQLAAPAQVLRLR